MYFSHILALVRLYLALVWLYLAQYGLIWLYLALFWLGLPGTLWLGHPGWARASIDSLTRVQVP